MFKNAVDAHALAKPQQAKPLAAQLLQSSSPSAPQQTRLYQNNPASSGKPLSLSTGNATRSNNVLGHKAKIPTSGRPVPAVNGIKRTSSGLHKVLEPSDGFEEHVASYSAIGRKEKDLIKPITAQNVSSVSDVYFDADDFSSDMDMEIENPNTKNTTSQPKPAPVNSSMFQPTRPVAASHATESWHQPVYEPVQKSSRFGNRQQSPTIHREPPPPESSQNLPWSSSPVEHFASISSRTNHPKNKFTGATSPQPEEKAWPPKRRGLPWQATEASEATQELQQANSGKKRSTSTKQVTSTPASKPNLPWNTTASALKEQQKNLRLASKKSIKTFEATDETKRDSIERIKKSTVSKIFLTSEQQNVVNLVAEHKKSVFFTGSAGTGKSVLLREIIAALRKKYAREPDRIAVTASTGLAACNIGGVTLHSFAGIGLGKETPEELVKKIKRNQKAKQRWMRTKVLIVDEISMVDGDLFDKLEAIARILRNNGRPFGGIQLIITGDFFQLPPVPDQGRVSKFSFDAGTWNTSIEHTIALHHVFRQKDPVFANMLNEMREGRLTPASIASFHTLNRPLEFDDGMEATELFPTRQEVDRANNQRLHQLGGDVRVFEARDGGTVTEKAFRDKLLQNCMAPERVTLKIGAQVMLIKNFDESLVNGSLGKIVSFMSEQSYEAIKDKDDFFQANEEDLSASDRRIKAKLAAASAASTSELYPVVEFVLTDGSIRQLLCQREPWKVEQPNGEVQASRSQVPLILAWALSIHKAQGQTIERVKVDLGKVFEKGQVYVALSRATSMQGLQVLKFDPRKVLAHEKVRSFYAGLSRAEEASAVAEVATAEKAASKKAARNSKKKASSGAGTGATSRQTDLSEYNDYA